MTTSTAGRTRLPARLGLTALIALVPLIPIGCSDTGCGDCGSGVAVWWQPGTLPSTATYELCVNGRCELVEPAPFGGDGVLLGVSPATAVADRDVSVRLTLRDGLGDPDRTISGSGKKVGNCCPAIEFRATSADRLTVEHGSD